MNKKNVIIIGFLLGLTLSIRCAAQGFKIKCDIKNVPDNWIYLTLIGPKLINVDSVKSTSGHFTFTGPGVAVPKLYCIRAKGIFSSLATFYLEDGEINITGERYVGVYASGTPLNDAYTEYLKVINPLQNRYSKIFYEMKVNPAKDKSRDQYKQQLESINDTIKSEMNRLIKKNSNNVLALEIINNRLTSMSSTDIEKAVALLDPTVFTNNKQVIYLKTRAAEMKRTEVGRTVPPISLLDSAGKIFNLSSLRGKYVLIDFWASWCHPCRAENPNVKKAYEMYKGSGFEVVAVSLDKTTKPWLDAMRMDGLKYINLIDPTGKVTKDYAILGIPQNFLIDPKGQVLATGLKGDDLQQQLRDIFK